MKKFILKNVKDEKIHFVKYKGRKNLFYEI